MRRSVLLYSILLFLVSCSTKSRENPQGSEQFKSEGMAIELNKSFGINQSGAKPNYPDYFGGYYHDGNGKLVVFVVKGASGYEKDIEKRVGNKDYLMVECEYSYDLLLTVCGGVSDFFTAEKNRPIVDEITINSVGIDTRNNRVFVSLKECTPEKIALFKAKVSGSPVIKFEEWNGPIIAQ